MIEEARVNLTKMDIIDKFDLVCADIFDENFHLDEKVDVVVLCYTLCTFINSYEQLEKILTQCCKHTKKDGYMLISDFSYEPLGQDLFKDIGMYTTCAKKEGPSEFDTFRFHIEEDEKGASYEIFNIPSYIMFKAGKAAGFNSIELKAQYPNPEYENDPAMVKYLSCVPSDYLMKFKFIDWVNKE